MMQALSKHIFYPLWDLKDGSQRLKEWKQLEDQQWWSHERLKLLQWERLQQLLKYASQHSPYYKKLFIENSLSAAVFDSHVGLSRIPVTSKQDIRNHLDQFISDEYDKAALMSAKTGGSTGVALSLYFDEACQEKRNAAQLMADRWSGWDFGVKKASIWGNPPVVKTLKQKLRHQLLDRIIYLDTMNLNDHSMAEFVIRWRKERPGGVFGHAHSIYLFARFLEQNQITDCRPRGIVATSMMLLRHERALIEKVFGCKVTNRYGCEEVGLIACECDFYQGMHINLPHVFVEILDSNGKPVKPGEPGKIVVTDLNNYAMPLIRYRVEDIGVYSEGNCACGRGFPLLKRLEGRVADFLKLPDGGQVAGISLVERTLTKIPGIQQMQLVQEALDHLVIKRVKGDDFNNLTDEKLFFEMRQVFDERVKLEIIDVPHIPQETSGKYRFSICKVSV